MVYGRIGDSFQLHSFQSFPWMRNLVVPQLQRSIYLACQLNATFQLLLSRYCSSSRCVSLALFRFVHGPVGGASLCQGSSDCF